MYVTFPIEIAPECPFPLSNIPFGIFNTKDSSTRRVGAAIGDYVLDVALLESRGLFTACIVPHHAASLSQSPSSFPLEDASTPSPTHDRTQNRFLFNQSTLNAFAAMPSATRSAVRKTIMALLSDRDSVLFQEEKLNSAAFFKTQDVQMHLPMRVGDFSDFMCARTHVENTRMGIWIGMLTPKKCGKLAGVPGAPPNFYAFPTAYNGRASSVVVSGTSIHRPRGMLRSPSSTFTFAPSQRMDFELEMGIFISTPVPFGHTIKSPDEAKEHIFGLVMLNDWSARDIQFAEMTPLGPFNGKGSGTTVSPWVVMLEALEGAEAETADEGARERMAGTPMHLRHSGKQDHTWDVRVHATVKRGGKSWEVSRANLRDLYWSPMQMVSHHASSGCGLRTGDLLGTGTISAVDGQGLGCLHEINKAGTVARVFGDGEGEGEGETLMWLEDGDEVVMTGRVRRKDGTWIGFGECSGCLEPCVEE